MITVNDICKKHQIRQGSRRKMKEIAWSDTQVYIYIYIYGLT